MVVLLNLVYEILDLQVEFGEFLVATLNLLLLFFVLFDQLQSAGFKILLLSFKLTPVAARWAAVRERRYPGKSRSGTAPRWTRARPGR